MDQLPPSRLPLHSIFLSLDLGLSILDYLSWGALVHLSNACRGFRSLTRGYMKCQVTNYLVKFIPDGKVDNLLEHLKRAGGCIVGGVPRCVMADLCLRQLYYSHPPVSLDIVVPLVQDTELSGLNIRRFLESDGGYVVWDVDGPRYPYHHVVSSSYELFSEVSPQQRSAAPYSTQKSSRSRPRSSM